MKTFIEMVKNQALLIISIAAREKTLDRLLEVRNLNSYYKNSYIEYYQYCQEDEDYFEIVGAKNHRCIPFLTFFLKEKMFFC